MKSLILSLASCLFLIAGCRQKEDAALFQRIDTAKSGLAFANRITENDTFNILDFEYVYNGGGVGAGDFNGDGLTDLYFTGNTADNKIFLNRGDFQFTDVTAEAGVAAAGRWCSGITVADINADGRPDLYVSATVYEPGPRRANLLFLNTGNEAGPDGLAIPHFIEVAATAGVADTSHTTQSAFLDYDRDGDLDLYLLINEMDDRAIPNRYLPKITDGSGRKNDKLFRNDGPAPDGLPRFTDVTREAGILREGYGLGVSVCDLNTDGWPDLYVTNDYISNDLLWINNQDGTFSDRSGDYLKHTSYSAMGNDVADLNNDGLEDVVAVDMYPENNLRRKAMMPPNNYTAYLNNDRFGYLPQFTRNTLQLNRRVNDSTFLLSDVGMMAGIASTDWSWSPLAADVDNDGDRDLLITNGFPRDVTDRDFMDYNVVNSRLASREMRLAQIPSIKIPNYAYENDGQSIPHFTKRIREWGFDYPSFSNGAVYADLDNDGDLDYVVNNINDSCFLFRNNLISAERPATDNSWIQLSLRQPGANPAAIGARVTVVTDSGLQTAFNSPVRGFLSSVADVLHFGLRPADSLRSVQVIWPDGAQEEYTSLDRNARTTLHRGQGQPAGKPIPGQPVADYLLAQPDLLADLPVHRDCLFIDFNVQPLLPHKLSEYGPGLAVADVNGDGLEDLYRSGSHFYRGDLLIQGRSADGSATFERRAIPASMADAEELGSLFFDADNDGDNDLYLVSGGSEFSLDRPELADQLLFNDGSGNFSRVEEALPAIKASGSCVRAADFDRDGDLDLFVGSRLKPARFPEPVDSYLLINDGKGKFTEQSPSEFTRIGLVCDALWTDYDNDGWTDLLVAGQGMGIRVFHNEEGKLEDRSPESLTDQRGWWNGLAAADFDRDGDMDYVAGNFGDNHLYSSTENGYIGLYGADFDGNGGYDLLIGQKALAEDGSLAEFPRHQRTDTEKQVISVKRRYPRHEQFGRATIEDVLSGYPGAEVTTLRANYLKSAWVENVGNGDFALHPLPRPAQVAPIFGMQPIDVNRDGYPDLVAIGNDYGTETGMGMLDALNGLVLLFDPDSHAFVPARSDAFVVPGNGRSLTLIDIAGMPTIVAAENRGPSRAFTPSDTEWQRISVPPNAQRVLYDMDGVETLSEVYYGSGYLSQATRNLWLPSTATNFRVITFQGEQLLSR
ncbi:VCBS repeat-containing protein [Lewinella sp. IMCC34191]|uniref:VCBS repeat-containing protein n=1 Tax=Lewinella sp. IMCC34191 TaxID=2259172 RepID=UPI0018E59CEA|nr:VCBS repeat-containing protein [Lewinella sp. IMCC34191]